MPWLKGAGEHLIRHLAALIDALGLVERPVDPQVDPALPVLLLGLGERGEAAGMSGRTRPGIGVTPLNSSDTKVKAIRSVP